MCAKCVRCECCCLRRGRRIGLCRAERSWFMTRDGGNRERPDVGRASHGSQAHCREQCRRAGPDARTRRCRQVSSNLPPCHPGRARRTNARQSPLLSRQHGSVARVGDSPLRVAHARRTVRAQARMRTAGLNVSRSGSRAGQPHSCFETAHSIRRREDAPYGPRAMRRADGRHSWHRRSGAFLLPAGTLGTGRGHSGRYDG
jgi:hypothetical protein